MRRNTLGGTSNQDGRGREFTTDETQPEYKGYRSKLNQFYSSLYDILLFSTRLNYDF